MTESATSSKHSFIDDLQGLALGVFLCGVGLHILTHVGLITGQTAGLAVIISYLTGWSFGAVFFVINIPFYALAYFRLGAVFTLKSLISVTVLSAVTELLPLGWQMGTITPWLAAVIAGCTTGIGLLAMFRHNGSLGGFGVMALIVQDTTGFRAGYFQLLIDAILFGVAFFILPFHLVIWSLLGAVIINLTIAVNHRPDRYMAR
ncbi:YitT family protein [Yoonia sp. I 8.24]|uniref:YitT family protein n=1 Tax=Yoonia sp. I 8.24 TaxID=1537229 RepID=UPI001EDCD9B0|nr:YitT family protein [Yoonia sp. I 8.24]MCG3267632.1 YitT family protein [Yoonia sp. I 8.24]